MIILLILATIYCTGVSITAIMLSLGNMLAYSDDTTLGDMIKAYLQVVWFSIVWPYTVYRALTDKDYREL